MRLCFFVALCLYTHFAQRTTCVFMESGQAAACIFYFPFHFLDQMEHCLILLERFLRSQYAAQVQGVRRFASFCVLLPDARENTR